MSNPEHQIKKSLTKLIFDYCFYGQLAMSRLTISENPALKFGMATDGINLWYSPTWIVKSPDWETDSVVAHEVIHCANGHPWRIKGHDPELANIAADHVTNLILLEDGFKLWKGAYADPRFKGWSYEEVYACLLRERQQQQQNKQQSKRQGAGEPQDEPEDSDEPEGQDEDEGSAGGDSGASDDDSDEEQDGSGSGEEEEDENPQPGKIIAPPPGVDPDSLQAEWTVAVFQAAQAAQAMGQLPAGLKQLVKGMRQPAVDWKAITRRFVQMCAKSDWTMRFPNQRYTYGDFYLPTLRAESLPPAGILWDTSGSRDYDEARKECASEVTSIIEECRPEKTYVIYADAAVQNVEEFEPDDPIVFNPVGGGGTYFKPVFDYIERENLSLAFLLVITDLDIFDLDEIEEPDFPVLWLKIGGYRKDAPFGEVIEVEPEHRHGY